MSDLQIILNGAKAIERVLVDEFGGSGRGLYEMMTSSRVPIPQALQRRIRYVATMRNKGVHELNFEVGGAAAFSERCARIVEDLRQLHADRQLIRTTQAATPTSASLKPWAWGAGAAVVLLLLAGGYTALHMVLAPRDGAMQTPNLETATRSAPLPAADQKFVPAPDPSAVVTRATATAATPAGSAGAATGGGAGAGTGSGTGTTTATAGAGYYGVANDGVSIEAASLRYQADASGRQVPIIEVSIRNASTATLPHTLLDARLYINGESEPVLINGKRKGANEAPLYAEFGASGLAVGETRTIRLPAAARSDWSMPEILKAKARRLVVEAADAADGRKDKIGAPAPLAVKPR